MSIRIKLLLTATLFAVAMFFVPTKYASAAFSSSSISNLQLWLDASSGATTDGTTSANDGETIQQWNDQSGNSRNAIQLTAGSRPTYKTSIFNGKSVLRFGGSHTLVTNSFLDSSFNTALTFFIVENKAGTDLKVSTSNQNSIWYSGRDYRTFYATDNLSDTLGQLNAGGTTLSVESYRYDGSNKTFKFNAATNTTYDTETAYGTEPATGNIGLSGALTVGALSNGTFGYDGDIAEILVYNRALTDSEKSQVEDYLMEKYVDPNYNSTIDLPLIMFDGDSMTLGVGSTGGQTYPKQTIDSLTGSSSAWVSRNIGRSGYTVAQMSSDASTRIDFRFRSSRIHNILVLFGGTNDLYYGADAATTYNNIVTYVTARRNAGYKVIINTILPRSGGVTPVTFEADRQTVNTLLRNNWQSFADGLSDIASSTIIGQAGDESNATYYADSIHPTNAGYAIVAASVAEQINTLTTPTITSLSPATATSAGTSNLTLTVNGTKFTVSSTVKFNGTSLTTTYVSSTQLTALVPNASLQTNGSYYITVANLESGGGNSVSSTLTIQNPTATITSLSPSLVYNDHGAFTLTVEGTGFNTSSVVNYAGSAKTTTFVSSTQITASILSTDLGTDGRSVKAVTVTNGAPGGGTSASSDFTVVLRVGSSASSPSSGGSVSTPAPVTTPVVTTPVVTTPVVNPTEIIESPVTTPVVVTPAPVVASYYFKRNLKAGNTGADVKKLQIFLNTHGFKVATKGAGSPGKETNFFGSATRNAIMKFQKANKIKPVNGLFGPLTRAAINKM